jgi:YD repeat-containing protein
VGSSPGSPPEIHRSTCRTSGEAWGSPYVATRRASSDGVHTYTYDSANQLLSEYHPIAGIKTWTFDSVGNRLSQDFTQGSVRTLTHWVYDAADQIQTETSGTAVTTFTFDAAGNQQVVQTPSDFTTNTWDQENRLTGIQLGDGTLNTMTYRWDNLRHQLADSEGTKLMVWDDAGPTGYVDLFDERQP